MFCPASILCQIPKYLCKISLAIIDMDIANRDHVRMDIEFWDLPRIVFIWEGGCSWAVVWVNNDDELKVWILDYPGR